MGIEAHFCGCQLIIQRVFLVCCYINCWLGQIFDIHLQNPDSEPDRHKYMILPQLIIINQIELMTVLTGPKTGNSENLDNQINDKVFETICKESAPTPCTNIFFWYKNYPS